MGTQAGGFDWRQAVLSRFLVKAAPGYTSETAAKVAGTCRVFSNQKMQPTGPASRRPKVAVGSAGLAADLVVR
jgi:hypothetical protein